LSQLFGRKIVIIVSAILAACFVPLYLLPRNFGLLVLGAFALYFGVQVMNLLFFYIYYINLQLSQ
jgi:SHS family lactate transporter-like MFS transporter